jgi:hypothetical protein
MIAGGSVRSEAHRDFSRRFGVARPIALEHAIARLSGFCVMGNRIEAGKLEGFEKCANPPFPEPLGGGGSGLESVSIWRKRFGPINYE